MGRIVAIDYGMKRCGMAMTDVLRLSINPLPTVIQDQLMTTIDQILAQEEIDIIVFGESRHKDGNLTAVGRKVQEIIARLIKKYPHIHFDLIDESYSSQQALSTLIESGVKKKKRRDKGTIDQMSAVIILKNYLETLYP